MNQAYKYASFWERLAAFIIDAAILVGPFFALYLLLKLANIYILLSLFNLSVLILFSIYNTFYIAKSGATIGKKLLRLKVVDLNYGNVSLKQTLIRETVGKLISFLLLGIGSIFILVDKNKQALYDKLARTYVVKTNADGSLLLSGDNNPKTINKVIFCLLLVGTVFFVAVILAYSLVGLPLKIVGKTMDPNYRDGQIVFIKQPLPLKRSDVVLYNVVINGKQGQFLQRLIAREGETVMLKDSKIYIDGNLLKQDRIIPKRVKTLPGKFIEEGVQYTIPAGYYFALGDNREKSIDSREMGFVPVNAIVGKVSGCLLNCK